EIPAIPTSVFKELELSCLPSNERTAVFYSSGTTEQRPSRHFHNRASLALYEASLLSSFGRHFQFANSDAQLIATSPGSGNKMPNGRWQMMILTPALTQAPHSSLAHMFETVRQVFGSAESAFIGDVADDDTW